MAAIQNLQVAVFCNQQIRPACDKFIQLYYWCKVVQEMWTSQGLAALIPNASERFASFS